MRKEGPVLLLVLVAYETEIKVIILVIVLKDKVLDEGIAEPCRTLHTQDLAYLLLDFSRLWEFGKYD
jgi:hypothetical protein